MSVSRMQIEAELHAAERAVEAAQERRKAAERLLYGSVAPSGAAAVGDEELARARTEYAAAEEERIEAERFVRDLRSQLRVATDREERLLAITDVLIARDQARRAWLGTGAAESLRPAPVATPAVGARLRRSFLGRLWRH